MIITPALTIDDKDIEESFVRASGPGGQNVNKVSSAVQLRFNLGDNESIHPAAKSRLRKIAGQKLTLDDVIVIHAETHRTQKANREEARRRLGRMIREAIIPPTPRKKTRISKGALQRRAQSKKQRSLVKSMRKRPSLSDR